MAIKDTTQGLANLGRHGDSTLVHMQPGEVAGLQALAKANGTSLTINPETGLPEAFSLGGFFKSLLPTVAGFAAAGMSGGTLSPMVAGILAGAGTGAITNREDPLMGAVMGGMGGYGGSNLYSAASGFGANATDLAGGPRDALSQAVSQAGEVMNPQQMSMFTPSGGTTQTASLASSPANYGAVTAQTAGTAPNFNAIPGATQGTGGYQPTSLMTSDTSNLQQAYKNVAADPMKFIGQNKMAVGMPLAGAALGGLEYSDLYGKPLNPEDDPNNKYDPYATLNLNTDSGLRLYATGGPVSFADGGDTGKDPAGLPGGGLGALKGGGSGATQGAGMVSLDVSDINSKLGYDPTSRANARDAGQMYGNGNMPPLVEAPKLGLFASNDQIEDARTAYERQLSEALALQSRAGHMGMGGINQGYTGMNGQTNPAGMGSPGNMITRTVGGGGMGSTARTADTADTALSRLNLNTNYANGGSIQAGGLQGLYGSNDDSPTTPMLSQNGYGLGRLQKMAGGGQAYAEGGYLDGAGDGMSDSIPATIDGKQPARLADGEFVIPADVVSHLGNGSSKAGSKRLYNMLDSVRKERTGSTKQGKQINPRKHLPV